MSERVRGSYDYALYKSTDNLLYLLYYFEKDSDIVKMNEHAECNDQR